MEAKPKSKLYACCGCGDPTTGSISEIGIEYDCCPCCCSRVDENNNDETLIDLTGTADRGPYRERGTLPKCPQCKGASERGDHSLECVECGHEWTPRGVYLPKRKAATR